MTPPCLIESIAAQIAADAEEAAGHIAHAIRIANQRALRLVSLPSDHLAAWLNTRPVQQTLDEFASHVDMGDALNDAAYVSELAGGKPDRALGRVDLRSLQERLAAQGRAIAITRGRFEVIEMTGASLS